MHRGAGHEYTDNPAGGLNGATADVGAQQRSPSFGTVPSR